MTSDDFALLALAGYVVLAAGSIVWQAFRAAVGPLVWLLYAAERIVCGLLWRVRTVRADGQPGRCPFPEDAGALIVANHRSPADPVILWQNHHLASSTRRIRRIQFLMAREFYDVPWLTWFYRAMGAIPVTRGRQDTGAVRAALAEIKAGRWVGIFPEGGINHGPPGVREANPGVAFLALNTNARIYPVYIAGSPIGSSMIRALFRRARTRVIYGDPIDLSAYQGRRKSPELLRDVTEQIMTTIAELGGVEYEGRREGGRSAEDARDSADDAVSRSFPKIAGTR